MHVLDLLKEYTLFEVCQHNEVPNSDIAIIGAKVICFTLVIIQAVRAKLHWKLSLLLLISCWASFFSSTIFLGVIYILHKDDKNIHVHSLVFDRQEMRPHIIKCLQTGRADTFPIRKFRQKPKIKCCFTVTLHCTCWMPEMPDCTMIEFSNCKEWFHMDLCVIVNSCALERNVHVQWLCTSCQS